MLGVGEVCRQKPGIIANITDACSTVKIRRRVLVQCDIDETGPVAVHGTKDIDCAACSRLERKISVPALID